MSGLTPLDKVQWIETKINKISTEGPFENHKWAYTLQLPDFLACWDAFDDWEIARFASMKRNLKPGMLLYDIGAEVGWCTALYAQFVGGVENLVIIEPTPEFWPNIRRTVEHNVSRETPRGCFPGLVGVNSGDEWTAYKGWPPESEIPQLIDKLKYRYIHEHADHTPMTTIDALVEVFGRPDALTMDVEGAELLVLQGSQETLRKHRPLVWVSVHPDLGKRDYGVIPEDVYVFMDGLGYERYPLGVDHEEHELFAPVGREVL